MQSLDSLKKRWDRRVSLVPFHPTVEINDEGLMLGVGTMLARMTKDRAGKAVLDPDADQERIAALLAVVSGRGIALDALAHIEAASDHWRRGDKALANLRLAFAQLPRLASRADAYRLFLADEILAGGVSPHTLIKELNLNPASLNFIKYDPEQPRVAAGNGTESGEFGSTHGLVSLGPASGETGRPASDSHAFLGIVAAARAVATAAEGTVARGAAGTLLGTLSAENLAALTLFAARFVTPTAVLGAIFIPSPGDGGVTEGTLPNAPNVRYKSLGPEGRLLITTTGANGSDVTVKAQNFKGLYVDLKTLQPIGRFLNGRIYLDSDEVENAIRTALIDQTQSGTDRHLNTDDRTPKLCPRPVIDTGHGASDRANAYENDVHVRVNPIAPIPAGFAVMYISPVTGRPVYFEDCFRYHGDLVDHDMEIGDAVEAKGPRHAFLLFMHEKTREGVMTKLRAKAWQQTNVTRALGIGLKWYFAEESVANSVREQFKQDYPDIVIAYMPPTKRQSKPRGARQ